MRIFLSAGEPSGDLHGANLLRSLRAIDPTVTAAGFGGEQMRPCHRDLYRAARKRRHGPEFGDETKVDCLGYGCPAGDGGMKHVRVVLTDRLGPGNALKSRDFLPEMVQHGIRRRMPIVSAPMHLAACDDVDPGDLLFQDCGLS